MVVLDQEVTLAQPAPFFGASMGKNKFSRWIPLTVLLALFAVATIFAPKEEFLVRESDAYSLYGIMLTLSIIGGVLWLFYTDFVFDHKKVVFRDNVRSGMYRWAATDLRDYLNARYGTNITPDQARELMSWTGSHIRRQHDGKTEYVEVFLKGIEPIKNCATVGETHVLPVPDVSKLNIELMMVVQPEKARVYEFTQG